MAQVLGSLTATWGTWTEFIAPGFGSAQSQAIMVIWELTNEQKSSFFLPVSIKCKQVHTEN